MVATAAVLPPELFPHILAYVGKNRYGGIDQEERRHLKTCSLVCLYWANLCREHLFRDLYFLTLQSAAELATLQYYARNGSPRLIPLISLGWHLRVKQTWAESSWCHHIFDFNRRFGREYTQQRTDELELVGPVPPHMPPAAYHSPHWSLPRQMSTALLPFTNIWLRDIHFPRLLDLSTLLKHLHCSHQVLLERTTWDQVDITEMPSPRRPGPSIRAEIYAIDAFACSNNFAACIVGAMLLMPSSFAHMEQAELDASLSLSRAIAGEGSQIPLPLRSLSMRRDGTYRNVSDRAVTPTKTCFACGYLILTRSA